MGGVCETALKKIPLAEVAKVAENFGCCCFSYRYRDCNSPSFRHFRHHVATMSPKGDVMETVHGKGVTGVSASFASFATTVDILKQ